MLKKHGEIGVQCVQGVRWCSGTTTAEADGRSREGNSPVLEAWRQLAEKYEPKMRTRFVGQLMSILSFSLQGDTAEQIKFWEREKATYERDSGKVSDDEIKIGTFLLRLPESQLKIAGAC